MMKAGGTPRAGVPKQYASSVSSATLGTTGAATTRRPKQGGGSVGGAPSQLGEMTPASLNMGGEEDELQAIRKRFQDVEERRLREWENYQRSHRSSLEQTAAKAYLDFSIGDVPAGRMVVELFEDVVPQTVENFRCLVTGSCPYDPLEAAPKLDYIDTVVHRVDRKQKIMCLGEMHGMNMSSTGQLRRDENFAIRHLHRGMLSMVSRGPNTVGSAFCITFDAAPSLDFKQVVFGKVIDGMPVLDKLEAVQTNRVGVPAQTISITFCGALTGPKPPGAFEIVRRKEASYGVSSTAEGVTPLEPSSTATAAAAAAAQEEPSEGSGAASLLAPAAASVAPPAAAAASAAGGESFDANSSIGSPAPEVHIENANASKQPAAMELPLAAAAPPAATE